MIETLPKWQLGDVVRILEDLCSDTPDYTHCGLMPDMLQYRGEVHIVKTVSDKSLNVKLDGADEWWWAPNWIKPVVGSDDDISNDLPPLDLVL